MDDVELGAGVDKKSLLLIKARTLLLCDQVYIARSPRAQVCAPPPPRERGSPEVKAERVQPKINQESEGKNQEVTALISDFKDAH